MQGDTAYPRCEHGRGEDQCTEPARTKTANGACFCPAHAPADVVTYFIAIQGTEFARLMDESLKKRPTDIDSLATEA